MSAGFFITFEGLDGSGKTTQLHLLEAHLRAKGREVVTLRQPGGTPLGDRIRALLLDSRAESTLGPVAPLAELALMFADRAQSIAAVIRPALAAGAIVLCDRYTDSSVAYQGAGRQLGAARVLALHQALCDDLQPDLTLLLLPPLATALARARTRNAGRPAIADTDENRFERESDAFYARIHAAYETIAARDPRRVALVTANASIDTIESQIRTVVAACLSSASN